MRTKQAVIGTSGEPEGSGGWRREAVKLEMAGKRGFFIFSQN